MARISFQIFQSSQDSDLSPCPHQSSIIFAFCPKDEVFLFTGDAGKEAIEKVLQQYEGLENINWLKVPHHGSKHNLNNAIIEKLRPKVSYISTEKYSKYANKCTVNALKKVGRVYSTHKDRSNLWHHQGTDSRSDYSSADSL